MGSNGEKSNITFLIMNQLFNILGAPILFLPTVSYDFKVPYIIVLCIRKREMTDAFLKHQILEIPDILSIFPSMTSKNVDLFIF